MKRICHAALFVGLCAVAGLGCKHVAGKCDCYHHADNNDPPAAGQPYHQIGAPVGGTAVPEKLGTPDKLKK
jgi:hypothetical protein